MTSSFLSLTAPQNHEEMPQSLLTRSLAEEVRGVERGGDLEHGGACGRVGGPTVGGEVRQELHQVVSPRGRLDQTPLHGRLPPATDRGSSR